MYKKSKKIRVNYSLLKTACSIETVGSVPASQIYQADLGEYTPDYTLTPLVLFPRCTAIDPDALTAEQTVNASLTNMKWYERVDGVQTLITAGNGNYTITSEGESKGQISVNRNVDTLSPVTLEFSADYADTRTGQVYTFRRTVLVRAIDGTAAVPVLMIDSPETVEWNPVRDLSQQVITARLMISDTDVTESGNAKFFFYRLVKDTGALEQITGGDADWEWVAQTGNVLTIDRDYIGNENTYVVKASYDGGGSPADTPDDAISMRSTTIRRRIPKLVIDWEGAPTELPSGTVNLYPKPIVMDTVGIIPEEVLLKLFSFRWYIQAPSATSYSLAAQEMKPTIPFVADMMLQLEVLDRGPLKLVTDTAGTSYVTDASGTVVVGRSIG